MSRKYIKIVLPIVIVVALAILTVFLISDTAASKIPVVQVQPTVVKPTSTPQPTATPEPTAAPTLEATVTPLPTSTPEPTLEATVTPEITATAEATPEPTIDASVQPTPEATPEVTPEPTIDASAQPTPEATPEPTPTPPEDVVALGLVSEPPTTGKWIDVNLTDGNTRLMTGRTLVKALPSAFGYGLINTETDYYATAPGTYYVYTRYSYRWYDAPYSQLWIDSFVGFDGYRANGFHSFLMNEKGEVVDSRLGPVSHGCVRVEDWKAVFDFSAIGMPVVVHGQYHAEPLPRYIVKD